MSAKMLLIDVETDRPKFRDGDRVIARVSSDLRKDQKMNLVRTITKFAKAAVRVWIVDCRRMSVDLIRGGRSESLVSLLHIEPHADPLPGKMNLSLSVVEFQAFDTLEIHCAPESKQGAIEQSAQLKDWTGREVEVRIIPDLMPVMR